MNVQPQLRRQLYEAQLGELMRRERLKELHALYVDEELPLTTRCRYLMLDGQSRSVSDICEALNYDGVQNRAVLRGILDSLTQRGFLKSTGRQTARRLRLA